MPWKSIKETERKSWWVDSEAQISPTQYTFLLLLLWQVVIHVLKSSIPESQRFNPKSEHGTCPTLFVKWRNELTQPNQDAGEEWMNPLSWASVVPLLGSFSGTDWLSKMCGSAEQLLLWFSWEGRDRAGKDWSLEKAALKEKDLMDKESFAEMPGMSFF